MARGGVRASMCIGEEERGRRRHSGGEKERGGERGERAARHRGPPTLRIVIPSRVSSTLATLLQPRRLYHLPLCSPCACPLKKHNQLRGASPQPDHSAIPEYVSLPRSLPSILTPPNKGDSPIQRPLPPPGCASFG